MPAAARNCTPFAAALSLLVGTAAAQSAVVRDGEPGRRPALGRVTAGGEPLAGAAVTLIGLPPHYDPRHDAAEVVTVATDAAGRYRAALQIGTPYLAFAAASDGTGGAFRTAPIRGWFGAGAVVDHDLGEVEGPYAVQLGDPAAWGERLPALSARPHAGPGWLPLALECPLQAGRAVWPPLPAGSFELRATGVDDAAPWQLPLRQNAERVLALPALVPLSISVTDEQGKGIAGAEVSLRTDGLSDAAVDGVAAQFGSVEVVVARTDSNGEAVVQLPGLDPFSGAGETLLFVARAPGRVERVSGFLGRHIVRDDRRLDRDDAREVRFTLPASPPVTGRVRLGSVPAAAGSTMRLRAVAKLRGDGQSYTHDSRSYDGRVDSDGAFAIDGVPDDLHSSELVLLPPGGGPPIECTGAMTGRPRELLVDLAALATLRVAVLDARAGPASGQAIYLCEVDPPGAHRRGRPRRHCVDPAGRGEFQLNPGTWFVLAADDDGCAWATVPLRPGGVERAELHLLPYPTVRGSLRDDQGVGVAGARLSIRGMKVQTPDGDDGGAALARSMLRARLERMLLGVTTASDGAFAVPYLPLASLVVTVRFGRSGRTTDDFPLRQPDAGSADDVQLRWQ